MGADFIARVRRDFGTIRATALTAEQVDEYIRGRQAEGVAKASVNRVTQLLKQGYTLAELPAPRIRRLDESDDVRHGFFTELEVRRVMASLPSEIADFTLFGWLTGMRKGANGYGTIFKITSAGALSTVYSFCSQTDCADGASIDSLHIPSGHFGKSTYR